MKVGHRLLLPQFSHHRCSLGQAQLLLVHCDAEASAHTPIASRAEKGHNSGILVEKSHPQVFVSLPADGDRWKPAPRSVDGSQREKRRSRKTTFARTCTAQPAGYSAWLGTTTTRWPRFILLSSVCCLRSSSMLLLLLPLRVSCVVRQQRLRRRKATRRAVKEAYTIAAITPCAYKHVGGRERDKGNPFRVLRYQIERSNHMSMCPQISRQHILETRR